MLCEPFGKRRAMQFVSVPMFMAWMLFHFASHVNHFYAGLALAGLGGGLMEAPVNIKNSLCCCCMTYSHFKSIKKSRFLISRF